MIDPKFHGAWTIVVGKITQWAVDQLNAIQRANIHAALQMDIADARKDFANAKHALITESQTKVRVN